MTRRKDQLRRDVAPVTTTTTIALSLLLLAPVAILPGGLNRFVLIKIACIAAAAAMSFLTPAAGRLPRWLVFLLIASAGIVVLSAILGEQPLAQLVGRGPRFEGLAVLPVYVMAGLAGARLLGPMRSRDAELLATRLLAGAAFTVAALATLESFGFTPLSSSVARPGSLLGNASDQGAWAVLVLGPLAARALATPDLLTKVGAGAAAICVVTSESRGALIGAIVVLASLTLLVRERRTSLMSGWMALAIVGATLLLPAARSRALGDNALAAATVPGRQLLWTETWHLLTGHLMVGVGPSGFGDAIVRMHSGEWYVTTGTEIVDSPHSWPLQAVATGGILLLLLASVVIGATAKAGLQQVRTVDNPASRSLTAGMLAGLTGYGTALLVHLTSPGPTAAAAVFGGALLALPTTSPAGVRQRVAASITGLVALVLLVGSLAELPLKSAIVAAQEGNLAAADSDFTLASRLRPWDPDLAAAAGHAFATLAASGNVDAARRGQPWLESAQRLTPLAVSVLADLATVAEAQQDLNTAATFLDSALARDGNNPQLLLQRGVLYAETRDYAAAERTLLRSASLAPHSPDPWTNLATLYQLQGRAADAERAHAKAAALTHP